MSQSGENSSLQLQNITFCSFNFFKHWMVRSKLGFRFSVCRNSENCAEIMNQLYILNFFLCRLSRSPSPPPERLRSKLTAAGSKNSGSVPSSQALTSVGTSGGGPNTANSSPVSVPGSPQRAMSRGKKTPVKHRSIISDVFDGKLLSSVQCLTCDRVNSILFLFYLSYLPKILFS